MCGSPFFCLRLIPNFKLKPRPQISANNQILRGSQDSQSDIDRLLCRQAIIISIFIFQCTVNSVVQYEFTDFELIPLQSNGVNVYICTDQYLEIRKNENLTNTGPRYELQHRPGAAWYSNRVDWQLPGSGEVIGVRRFFLFSRFVVYTFFIFKVVGTKCAVS